MKESTIEEKVSCRLPSVKFAYNATYKKGSDGYKTLDEMTDIQLGKLGDELTKLGFSLVYNCADDSYTVKERE